MKDIADPDVVEIQIKYDSSVIWVNVDGKCALRVCGIPALIICDQRKRRRRRRT